MTRVEVDGRAYGGSAQLFDDGRVAQFRELFPEASSVLELGSLEGAHSFQLAEHAARVVAVEGRAANLERARYLQQLLGVANVEFVEADVEKADLTALGSFDAVFCVGLLYHLTRPWKLIDTFARLAPRVYLQTHFAEDAEDEVEGVAGSWYDEWGKADPLSGLSSRSFWMTLPALRRRLEANGYETRVLEEDTGHPYRPIVTIAAGRS